MCRWATIVNVPTVLRPTFRACSAPIISFAWRPWTRDFCQGRQRVALHTILWLGAPERLNTSVLGVFRAAIVKNRRENFLSFGERVIEFAGNGFWRGSQRFIARSK